MRAQRRHVGHDPGLVVGGAAAVEPPLTLGGLEGRAVPQGLVAGRLHVVVRVEHDGARPGRAVGVPDDRGAAALAHDLDVEPLGAQQGGGRLGAGLDVRLVEGVEADAGDPGERLEVGAEARHQARRRGRGGRRSGRWRARRSPARPYPRRTPDAGAARFTASRPSTYSGGVFGRSKTTNDQLVDELHPQRDGAKNKPTPKRKDQEAARKPAAGRRRPQAGQADRQGQAQRAAGQDPPGDAHRRRLRPAGPRQGPGAPLHARLHRRPAQPRRVHAAGHARSCWP